MQPEFWKDRWREGKIGFHEGKPNSFLERHAKRIADRRCVLVPLCGKSEDLAFLAAHDHQVIGIELVEDAVKAFFAEHGLTPQIERHGAIKHYTSGAITLLAGDLFAVTGTDVGAIDAIYDRAALIALPSELRRRYIDHLHLLVPPRTPTLLVTLEYPQDRIEGPPFAVLEPEVRALYTRVTKLEDRPGSGGRIAESGIPTLECCYLANL